MQALVRNLGIQERFPNKEMGIEVVIAARDAEDYSNSS